MVGSSQRAAVEIHNIFKQSLATVHRLCKGSLPQKVVDDYPIIHRVLTIPGGAGFRPSTVCKESFTKNALIIQVWKL